MTKPTLTHEIDALIYEMECLSASLEILATQMPEGLDPIFTKSLYGFHCWLDKTLESLRAEMTSPSEALPAGHLNKELCVVI